MKSLMKAARIGRRTFLEQLGLGAGGIVLSPIVKTLVSEAQGQTMQRTRFVVFMHGSGLSVHESFTPPEFRTMGTDAPGVMNGPKQYTWPSMVRTLAPWRNRMLLVDGLANHPVTGTSGHGTGFSALSGFAAGNNGSNEANGLPGNITIDQFIANKIGAGTRAKSVLFGASTSAAPRHAMAFAAGPLRPEPHFQSPPMMFQDLFGALAIDSDGVNRGAYKQGVLLDRMRKDIKRVSANLAGPERLKLDQYLTGVEDVEKRLKIVSAPSCKTGSYVQGGTSVEDRLEAMNEMATLALTCGMTNVVGVSVGCGNPHTQFPKFTRLHTGTRFESDGGIHMHGHSAPDIQAAAWDILHNFHGSLIARTITALEAVKEGDKTAFDSTVILYLSDNGHSHHNVYHERFPLFLIGNAGGKLKTDGRFIRYPLTRKGPNRPLVDLYSTLSTACGVPTDAFGKGGNHVPRGPLTEILA